jgi:hypothetical protein
MAMLLPPLACSGVRKKVRGVPRGARDQLTTIERALVEGFAGAALTLNNLHTRLALGEAIDLSQHAQAVSAMVRIASRLGVQRRMKDVIDPDPLAYARQHDESVDEHP